MTGAATANAFIGKPKRPTEAELSAELGASKALWDELVADLAAEHKLTQEWNSYSKKAGWSLRLKLRDRNIVYLSPLRGSFRASFALGDKAVKAALAGGCRNRSSNSSRKPSAMPKEPPCELTCGGPRTSKL
jgi:hypothetical protein